jgi:hypothetical protein
MTNTIKETIQNIRKLTKRYREYNTTHDYEDRNTHFDRNDELICNLEDNMSNILSNISDNLYDIFIEDNNLDKDNYETINKLRYSGDIVKYISNDYLDLKLDLPKEWLKSFLKEYLTFEFKIDGDTLLIEC